MKDQIYGYHIFDSRQIKEKIQKKVINVTITSPPYWQLKNYDSDFQIGFGQSYENYINDLIKIFGDIYKLTRDDGSLWIVIDTFKQNREIKLLPFDLAARLKEIGWRLQDIIIWVKDKNLPWSHKGKFRNIYEYILFFSKGNDFKFYIDRIKEPKKIQNWWIKYPERYNPKGKAPERLWEFSIPTQGSWSNGWVKHFCPFPPKMIERIILLTTNKNDTILDPFAGSGVVLAQSIVMGRKAVGFDINDSYKDMYEKKVLPYIQSEWEKRQKELVGKQKESKRFSSTIRILRQLKYPKVLIKSAQNKRILNPDSISFVLILGNKNSSVPQMIFILNDDTNEQKLRQEFELIASRPPLSKYGLTPRIEIGKKENFKEIFEKYQSKFLFIYEDGNTHVFKKYRLGLSVLENDALTSATKNKFPTIVSNLSVRALSPKN